MSYLRMQGCRKQPNEWTAWAKAIMAQQCQCVLQRLSMPRSMSALWTAPISLEPMKVRQKYQQSLERVLVATQPAAAPAKRLLSPSSFQRMRRRVQRTNLRVRTMAGRKRAMVKQSPLRLCLTAEGFFARVFRVRMSCRARLMSSPYLRFLKACLSAEMMQPQPWVQKVVCELISYSMKFIAQYLSKFLQFVRWKVQKFRKRERKQQQQRSLISLLPLILISIQILPTQRTLVCELLGFAIAICCFQIGSDVPAPSTYQIKPIA